MTTEFLSHVESNQELFKTWIDDKSRLQIGKDVLQPLIAPFKEEFPTVNLIGSCHECIIDMLVWAVGKYKESAGTRKTVESLKKEKK